MKKKAYKKNLIRMIFNTKARFLSIFCIVFLGAAFFAGLRQTPLIMANTMNRYLSQNHYNDLNYIGTLGYDEDDIQKLKGIKEIDQIDYGIRFDALISPLHTDKQVGATVYTSEFNKDVNHPDIKKGRLPQKDNECLFDAYYAKNMNYKIGDQIHIESSQETKEFTIVGLVSDSRYICDYERGANTLGDGTNACFIEILTTGNESLALPEELYTLRDQKVLYNDLRITLKQTKTMNIFSDTYDDYIKKTNKKIKGILKDNYQTIHTNMASDASRKIAENEANYQKGVNEYNDGLAQYNAGLKEYQDGLAQYQSGYQQYQKGYNQYSSGRQQYNQGYQQYLSGKQDYDQHLAQYNQLQQGIQFLDSQSQNYQTALQSLPQLELLYQSQPTDDLLQQITQLKELVKSYQDVSQQIGDLQQAKQTATKAKEELDHANQTLQETQTKLAQTKKTLDTTQQSLAQAKKKLDTSHQQLQQAKTTLDQTQNQLNEAKVKIEEGRIQLDDAKSKVNDIPTGSVVSLTKQENASILTFDANCQSINALSLLFPMIFFLVAALVSLTTMTRMVEEQRVQSGSLRALGYSKNDVIFQYLIYGFLSTFFASGLGIIAGTYFFPNIIYYLYSMMMYDVQAPILIQFDLVIILETFLISVAIVLAITYAVCFQEMHVTPAQLLRPKAPKIGKRILLERIPMIWSRLSFTRKVTMRNIFRYKKRFIMSIIGIAGCTALIVVAEGLKYSINPLVDRQYGDIWTYDGIIKYDQDLSQNQIDQCALDFKNQSLIKNEALFYGKTVTVDDKYYVDLEVPQYEKEFTYFTHLKDQNNKEKIELPDDGVILTKKAAELMGVNEGDYIHTKIDDQNYKIKVSKITTFYFRHYMYMTPDFYKALTGKTPIYNSGYFSLKNNTYKNQDKVTAYADQQSMIDSTTYIKHLSENFTNQMQSINSVVLILVGCAAALNFIVLYNLTNINIQERKSEIATIKVLGFYRKEVYDYVFRENIILAFIGSILGLGVGTLIHGYLIRTVEVDLAMFIRTVNPISYGVAIILTLIFTMMINYFMRHVLNKIDMVESLKSIE